MGLRGVPNDRLHDGPIDLFPVTDDVPGRRMGPEGFSHVRLLQHDQMGRGTHLDLKPYGGTLSMTVPRTTLHASESTVKGARTER